MDELTTLQLPDTDAEAKTRARTKKGSRATGAIRPRTPNKNKAKKRKAKESPKKSPEPAWIARLHPSAPVGDGATPGARAPSRASAFNAALERRTWLPTGPHSARLRLQAPPPAMSAAMERQVSYS